MPRSLFHRGSLDLQPHFLVSQFVGMAWGSPHCHLDLSHLRQQGPGNCHFLPSPVRAFWLVTLTQLLRRGNQEGRRGGKLRSCRNTQPGWVTRRGVEILTMTINASPSPGAFTGICSLKSHNTLGREKRQLLPVPCHSREVRGGQSPFGEPVLCSPSLLIRLHQKPAAGPPSPGICSS